MNRFLNLICCGILGSLSYVSSAQLTTLSLGAVDDTYTDTRYPTTPYGGNSLMTSGTSLITGLRGGPFQYHQRAFVEFDLNSIPANAIIQEAEIRLFLNGTSSGTFNWVTKMITSSWSEGSVTANNQPSISQLTSDRVTSTPVSSGLQKIDVQSMVQRMVYGAADNYGWCIQVSDESATTNTGARFNTKEANFSFLRPVLYIRYFIPVSLSNVLITHESATGASDGSITFNHSLGGSAVHTYLWEDGNGNPVPGGTTQNLSGLSYGWYGVTITGSNGEVSHFGFLVGTDCEEVEIIYNSRPEFTQNAWVYDRNIAGGINYGDVNYGNNSALRTDNLNNFTSWDDIKSYIEFNTWMDDQFTINQADFRMNGWTHWNSGTTNTSDFRRLTTSWNEDVVTWNTSPTTSGAPTPLETVPNTVSSSQNATVDMTDFWNIWKANNADNHGLVFQLDAFDNDAGARQMYYSPNAVAGNRPQWRFRLGLYYEDDVFRCNPEAHPYAELKRELDGGYALVYNDELKFTFQEDYIIDSDLYWTITIYDDQQVAQASCDAIGTTINGMPISGYSHDDNRFTLNLLSLPQILPGNYYTLEVTTEKGIKQYLKFYYPN